MKKILYILLFLCMCGKIDAQSVVKEGAEYYYYCRVGCSLDKYGVIYLPSEKDAMVICDSSGEQIKFQSLFEVVNYMAKRGWEYIETSHGKFLTIDIDMALIKKSITDDSQVNDHLVLKPRTDNNKKKKKED